MNHRNLKHIILRIVSTLTCFAGVDSHGTSSVYIATDSRGTIAGNLKWECCQKAYGSLVAPLLVAYVGDVLFSSQLAPRIIQLGEFLLLDGVEFLNLISEIELICKEALSKKNRNEKISTLFEIVIACRYGKSRFEVASVNVSNSIVMTKIHELPTHSGIILSLGSGGENVKKQLMAWKKIPGENTSRAIFMAHCDALLSEEEKVRIIDSDGDKISFERDIFSGGAPQLVSLYRVGNANIHGIVWKRKKFLNGIAGKYFLPTLNWRDRKFQNCDPLSLKPKTDAKLHRHEITIRKRMT